MTPYNVEIFSPDFSFKSAAQVEFIDHEYDYLDIGKASIEIPGSIWANKGDWIHITRNEFETDGIVSSCKKKRDTTTIEYKPFLRIFDVKIYTNLDELESISLEEWIKETIEELYVYSQDSHQNIVGLQVKTRSSHKNTVLNGYKQGINNLYDIILTAFTSYGIVCDFRMDIQDKKLILEIGDRQERKKTIEADLENILKKEIVIKESSENTNKLIIYNEENYDQTETFYLTASNEITTEDRDRVIPVICDSTTAKATKKATFAEVAKSKAERLLKASEYDNLIELTMAVDDALIQPTKMRIGQSATIISENIAYDSILTGVKYDEEQITLVFGAIRLEMTKILKRRFRENGN